MKIILVFLAIIMIASSVLASSFLTCDDPKVWENVTNYQVNGAKVTTMTIVVRNR